MGYQPKPSLHGLSLSKSPIKKPRNIIRVGTSNRIKKKLGSTKPDKIDKQRLVWRAKKCPTVIKWGIRCSNK